MLGLGVALKRGGVCVMNVSVGERSRLIPIEENKSQVEKVIHPSHIGPLISHISFL